MSRDKPYAGVICRGGHGEGIPACGKVGLTQREYERQMDRPDRGWHCPRCGGLADFDDERFEELQGVAQEPPTLTVEQKAALWQFVSDAFDSQTTCQSERFLDLLRLPDDHAHLQLHWHIQRALAAQPGGAT